MAKQKLREIYDEHADPRDALMASLGANIVGMEVFHNFVLVATYIRPEKTKGGIILSERTLQEDRFQGKIGLVVHIGPCAFKDDSVAKFGGVTLTPGEWVFYRPGDGFEVWSVDNQDGGTSCRLFEDTKIMGRVPNPSVIW